MMRWIRRIQQFADFFSNRPDSGDMKYEAAIRLADEISHKMRERSKSPNPFRGVLSDMLLGAAPDVALIADAFEAGQEARIFRGPPNGKG